MHDSSRPSSTTLGVIAEIHFAPDDTAPVRWHNVVHLDRTRELLDRAIEYFCDQRLDALVLLGDLSNAADPESLRYVRDRVASLNVPVLVVPGNHDIDAHPLSRDRFRDHLSADQFAVAPASMTLTHEVDATLVEIQRDAQTGRLASSRLSWNAGPAKSLHAVFTHFPLKDMEPELTDADLKHAGDLSDRESLWSQLLQAESPVVVVHGHLHVRAASTEGRLLHLSCGALVEPPHEVSVLRITTLANRDLRVDRTAHAVWESPVEKSPVLSPAHESWRFADGHWNRV
ncbi:MAG: metallophosphoesterase [Thermomicrobiales bacterium]